MSLCLLPCEIYYREFYAKLLLSIKLSSAYNITSLIGNDRHFGQLIPFLSPSVLLDKSCSSIMWNARIKPVKKLGGSVIVSDEEGFNNIVNSNSFSWRNRVDLDAAASIDVYAAWGKIDSNFFSSIPQLKEKIAILGNCRSDLLHENGKKVFMEKANGLNSMLGDYVLCSDNFCVENRRQDYQPPPFAVSPEKNHKASVEFNNRLSDQRRRRNYFASLIEFAAKSFPSKNFVIRPHPVSDPRWWLNRFWMYQNIHIINIDSIEPWLHSACCMVSMGCTTGLQAAIARVPVLDIDDPEEKPDSQNFGYSSYFAQHHIKDSHDFLNHLSSIFTDRRFSCNDELLSSYWEGSLTGNTTSSFAQLINDKFTDYSSSEYNHSLKTLHSYQSSSTSNNVIIDPIKWPSPSFKSIIDIIESMCNVYRLAIPKLTKISNCLYLVSP